MKDAKSTIRIPVERKWYCCPTPGCEQHLIVYDDTAKCRGVFIKCKRCGKEVEVKI